LPRVFRFGGATPRPHVVKSTATGVVACKMSTKGQPVAARALP
jgi:hypothetical protein